MAFLRKRLRLNPFRNHRRSQAHFHATPIEERERIIEYMANIIDTREASRDYEEVLNTCIDMIGKRRAHEMLMPIYPQKLKDSELGDITESTARALNPAEQERCIVKVLRPELDRLMKSLKGRRNREYEYRIVAVQDVFRLTDEELAILEMFFIIESNPIAAILKSMPFDMTEYQTLLSIGHKVLGLDRRLFLTAVKHGCLLDARLLNSEEGAISIHNGIRDYLVGLGDRQLSNSYFDQKIETHLKVADFNLPPDDLNVLQALLRDRKGCNILFYGLPGTGKTSLAAFLARAMGFDLYKVKVSDDEHTPDFRLRAIIATLNAAQGRKSIVLVDEADEVLNTSTMFMSRTATAKSWVNDLLDSHNQKIIWITNSTGSVESSTMRRFDFSLEFEKLTMTRRRAVLQYELKKHGLADYFTQEELKDLSKRFSVDAGGIVHAINVLKIKRGIKKETALRLVESVLRSHEKAVTGKEAIKILHELRQYTLEGLNTSHDLDQIVSVLKAFGAEGDINKPRAVTLLLYGPPGTGKSEFVHYLGKTLEKDVLLKRASDIQDPYVGMTEKHIARAFREAQEEKGILFFDEADTFLFPRKDALRSWEKSFTNEILAQLDGFQGIAVFATNDIEGLDHAAIRRFKFKVRFFALAPEGNLHFYRTLLLPLVPETVPLTADHIRQIKDLYNLTPGDFAVVKDQFSFGGSEKPGHQSMIDSLRFEVEHKNDHRRITGFA